MIWLFVVAFILTTNDGLKGQETLDTPDRQLKKETQTNPDKPTSFWPDDVQFDDSIPTPEQHFGFDIGVRHLDHAQVVGYLQRLADLSPRVSIETYATSHGGRPLLMLTITSETNRQNLQKIRKAHQQLANGDSDVDVSSLPAVINMGYGVHGDESSATNCAPLVAYFLAAAKGQQVESWLDSCVILLDPSLNPDGFNRFANWANRYRGAVVNDDPQHAEHNQMWPPGRVNYYWFDLNRDWLPAVHPESRGRLRQFHRWKPNVVLDFHEMGSGSSYFFQPGIPARTNPMTPAKNQEITRRFSQYHSKKLDQRGSLYFTQERFDDFYMGKGSTYPDLHGSIGILFEQASSRGHVQATADGLLKFHDTIANQFTTSLTSLQATTDMRQELLEYKRNFYQQSLANAAQSDTQTFAFTIDHNVERLDKFAELLQRHDIQCFWLKEDLAYGDRIFGAHETLLVPVDQPEFRFLKSLLMRRTRFRENIFYDVSAWTLSLAYGLKQSNLKQKISADQLVAWEPPAKRGKHPQSTQVDLSNSLGYVIDYRDDRAVKLMARLLKQGIKVRVAQKPFEFQGPEKSHAMPRGSLAVLYANQEGKRSAIDKAMQSELAQSVPWLPIASGLSVQGPDLGSSSFALIREPDVAMLIGPSTSAYGTGEAWHALDHELRFQVTLLKDSQLNRSDLDRYTTLILIGSSLDNTQWSKVENFARAGGTVVVCGSQAVSIQGKLHPENSSISSIPMPNLGDETNDAGTIQKPFDQQSNERALQLIYGAIFRTQVDLTHPLLYGLTQQQMAVFRNHSSLLQPSSNVYQNPMIYDRQSPLMAGYCSDENVNRIKSSASVVVHPTGRGRFILMADDPNFRGFWKSTQRVFYNAVFWGDLTDG